MLKIKNRIEGSPYKKGDLLTSYFLSPWRKKDNSHFYKMSYKSYPDFYIRVHSLMKIGQRGRGPGDIRLSRGSDIGDFRTYRKNRRYLLLLL